MDVKDMTEPVFEFADKRAYKQVIILMVGMILFFGTICYFFWKQHLVDDGKLETSKEKIIETQAKRIEKLEIDNDVLRKDFRDVVNPQNRVLDTIKGNVSKMSKILEK